jgi:hypothetical protein
VTYHFLLADIAGNMRNKNDIPIDSAFKKQMPPDKSFLGILKLSGIETHTGNPALAHFQQRMQMEKVADFSFRFTHIPMLAENICSGQKKVGLYLFFYLLYLFANFPGTLSFGCKFSCI